MKAEIVTITQFAAIMDVTRDTVYKWIDRGGLPIGASVKKVAGRNFIRVTPELVAEQKKREGSAKMRLTKSKITT
jgi:excisionase family DNA binding protein